MSAFKQPSRTNVQDHVEIRALTSLRAVAALLVVCYHFGQPYSSTHNDALAAVFSQGWIGVVIFFVLSGFLITLRYVDAVQEQRFKIREYFVKRIARIYPLYFVMLFGVLLFNPAQVAWPHFLVAQGFFNDLVLKGVPTAWSLTVEECFYLLLPLILYAHFRSRLPLLVTLTLWTLVLLIIGHGLVLLHIPVYGFMASDELMLGNTIAGNFPVFALGMLGAFAYRRRKRWPIWLAPLSLVGLFATMITIAHTDPLNLPLNIVLNYLCAGWTIALILGLTASRGLAFIFEQRLFVYLGKISYALYLVQLTPIGEALAFGATFIAQCLILEGLSALFYEFIEHPAQRFILRIGLRKVPAVNSPELSAVIKVL